VIRIGIVIAVSLLALVVGAGGRPPPHQPRSDRAPQPINLTLRFKMAEDMG
jgi:hypothetical protein